MFNQCVLTYNPLVKTPPSAVDFILLLKILLSRMFALPIYLQVFSQLIVKVVVEKSVLYFIPCRYTSLTRLS